MSSLDNLKPLIVEYGELTAQKKAIEARLKELGSAIRPTIEGRGAIVADNYQIECTMQAGRKTLDKAALLEAGINPDDYSKVGAPFTKMTVKEIENV